MPNVQIMPAAPIKPTARTLWVKPKLVRLDAAGARAGLGRGADMFLSGS